MEFYFNEHLRLDWGFGNPNKTAALIAVLLVLVHGFRYLKNRRVGHVLFVLAFLVLGVCLVHTYSRGGIVAALAGQSAFLITRHRGRLPWPSKKQLLLAGSIATALVVYACLPRVEAMDRYSLGLAPGEEPDRSISNRLRIWKDTPRMMVDAPRGWGTEEAGRAWMLWYQPLETRYRYRTLVNSHLTWLVEFGWVGRFLYLAGWSLVFLIGFAGSFPQAGIRRSASLSVGVWTSFAVAAFFSSVAESFLLWLIPGAMFVWMAFRTGTILLKGKEWKPILRGAALASGFSGVLLLLLAAVGAVMRKGQESIRFDGRELHYRDGPATSMLVEPDEKVLGRHFSYEIRRPGSGSWIVVDEMPPKISPEIEQVILSGVISAPSPAVVEFEGEVVWMNPLGDLDFYSRQKGETRIILGALRKDPTSLVLRHRVEEQKSWGLALKPGKQIYLGDWVSILSRQKIP